MCKVVARSAVREGDIQLYQAVDLSLPPSEACQASEEGAAQGTPCKSPDIDGVAPLLLMMGAQERAEEILAQARLQTEQWQQEASQQGVAQGRATAEENLLPCLAAFAEAGQALIVLEEQLVFRFTPQLVRLALEIAEKVVGKAVVEDPQIVASVLERARAEVPDTELVRIWLHPTDHQILVEMRPDLVRVGVEGGRKVEVVASEEVSRGGCRVETEIGVVDATIPVQMQECKRQMLDEEPQLAAGAKQSALNNQKSAEGNGLNDLSGSSSSSNNTES